MNPEEVDTRVDEVLALMDKALADEEPAWVVMHQNMVGRIVDTNDLITDTELREELRAFPELLVKHLDASQQQVLNDEIREAVRKAVLSEKLAGKLADRQLPAAIDMASKQLHSERRGDRQPPF